MRRFLTLVVVLAAFFTGNAAQAHSLIYHPT